MVAYLTACPVPCCELGKVFDAGWIQREVRGEESDFGLFVRIGRLCALDNDEASTPWKVGLKGLEGIELYASLVEATVSGVGLLCVGKKGVACSAVR